jgi:hypothetical protein
MRLELLLLLRAALLDRFLQRLVLAGQPLQAIGQAIALGRDGLAFGGDRLELLESGVTGRGQLVAELHQRFTLASAERLGGTLGSLGLSRQVREALTLLAECRRDARPEGDRLLQILILKRLPAEAAHRATSPCPGGT